MKKQHVFANACYIWNTQPVHCMKLSLDLAPRHQVLPSSYGRDGSTIHLMILIHLLQKKYSYVMLCYSFGSDTRIDITWVDLGSKLSWFGLFLEFYQVMLSFSGQVWIELISNGVILEFVLSLDRDFLMFDFIRIK